MQTHAEQQQQHTPDEGTTAMPESLRIAAQTAHVEYLQEMLEYGVNVNARRAADGWTALHGVAMGGSDRHMAAVQLLLSHGADPNAVDTSNETPLHWAVSFANLGVMQQLLQHGARLNTGSVFGWSPLALAARLGHKSAMQLLCQHAVEQAAAAAADGPGGSAKLDTAEALQLAAEVAAGEQQWGCWAHAVKAGCALHGADWLQERLSGLQLSDWGPACAALVQEWLGELRPVLQPLDAARAQKRELSATASQLQTLLLLALGSQKQAQQSPPPQQKQQQEEAERCGKNVRQQQLLQHQ